MDILAKEDSHPEPGLHPLHGDWKIAFKDNTAARHADIPDDKAKPITTTIDLPLMFELHNEDLQTILKVSNLLPKEGLRDEDWNLLVLEPTAEDAKNLAEILIMDPMTQGWVATSSLLSRIQEAYMTNGPPPKRDSPIAGQPDLLVVEDDLDALVRLYHYYRDESQPKLRAVRLKGDRMPKKNEMKEIAGLVDMVVRRRNEVRVARNKAVGIELKTQEDKTKKEKTSEKRKTVPRSHPISPWFQDPFGITIGSDRMPMIPWLDQNTTGQSRSETTVWKNPDAEDRYRTASVERAQVQLAESKKSKKAEKRRETAQKSQNSVDQPSTTSSTKGVPEGELRRYTTESYQRAQESLRNLDHFGPKRQDGLEEWCKSVKSADLDDLDQFLEIEVDDVET